MAKVRDAYWDTLKAVLIVLVVLGHTGTMLGNNWLSIIYAFHMPLFIFISGYFSRKKPFQDFWKGYKKLIILYVVFNTAYIALDLVTGTSISWGRLLVPSFAMWYILSLLYWRAILQFSPTKLIDGHAKLVIGLVFILSVFAGFVPLSTQMSFQRAFAFMPFFFLGYYARKSEVVERLRASNKIVSCIIFVLVSASCYYYLPVAYCNSEYIELPNDVILRMVQLVVAIVLSTCVLICISNRRGGLSTNIGKYTLLIYLLHPPVVKILKMVTGRVGFPNNLLTAILITIVTVAFIYSLRKFKLLKYLT